jgi:glycosyltransferase involved in cell wall biosynthesis
MFPSTNVGPDDPVPLRIGLDISTLRFPHTGIAVYTLQLICALQRQIISDVLLVGFTGLGFRTLSQDFIAAEVASNDARGRPAAPAAASPAMLALMRGGGARRRLLRFVKERAFEWRADQCDLFHATVTLPPGRTRTPLIPLVYDLSLMRHPETHPRERVAAFTRWLPAIREAPVINTISGFSRAEITALLGIPAERIVVTLPGVDPLFLADDSPAARAAAMRRFGVREGGYILAVGSLEPRKNLPVVLEAFASLPDAVRGAARLLVVGPPGWGDVRMPAAARRLCEQGAIRLTGYVDRMALRSLYGGAALLVYPSIYEGFGIPAAEALACGTPVAASRGSSLDEVVGPHGTLLPAHDVAGWREAMDCALGGAGAPDAAARAARRRWAAQFDWDTTAAQTLAMYRALKLPGAATQPARGARRAASPKLTAMENA